MNTEAILSGIVLVLFVVLLVVLHKARKARAEAHGRDVGLAVFVEDPTEDDVNEDINNPRLETIDLALTMTTDPAARNWLLDKRIDAMRRAS